MSSSFVLTSSHGKACYPGGTGQSPMLRSAFTLERRVGSARRVRGGFGAVGERSRPRAATVWFEKPRKFKLIRTGRALAVPGLPAREVGTGGGRRGARGASTSPPARAARPPGRSKPCEVARRAHLPTTGGRGRLFSLDSLLRQGAWTPSWERPQPINRLASYPWTIISHAESRQRLRLRPQSPPGSSGTCPSAIDRCCDWTLTHLTEKPNKERPQSTPQRRACEKPS